MKFISWNVNGLRACMQKGFEDSFKALDADISACRKLSYRQDSMTLNRKDIISTGIMPRKRDIPVLLFLPEKSP